MKKIAIIVQRYGKEVNGGAEFHAKILAEQLAKKYDITILTTTALDYKGWANHFPEGESFVDGIKVVRFDSEKQKPRTFRKARRAILQRKKYFKVLRFFGLFEFFDKNFNITNVTQKDVDNWLAGQGPYCKELISYLKKNKNNYDAFIFFTYLYYPTAVGMPLVKEKAIFIPTAHDEQPLYTKPYENLFAVPKFIMYNTQSEKDLVENHFKNHCKYTDIAGVGIEPFILSENYSPKLNFKIEKPYFVYVGRIDAAKGCDILVDYFNRFANKNPDLQLIMIGKDFMGVSANKNIQLTGFISEEDKYYLLQNSLGLILPSKYESLSMVTLEAMAVGKIPIVNKECEVLKNHIDSSEAGFYFNDYQSFEETLNRVYHLSESEKSELSEKAKRYVSENYTWDNILEKFDQAIDFVVKNKG